MHARRQYDFVDPANRLVAGELERRWNEALAAVHGIGTEIAELEAKKPAALGEKERQHLMRLGADLARARSHPAASAATRKRILRTALKEIVARIDNGFIGMVLHWQGGDHTALKLKMNAAGKRRWTVPEDTLTLVRELARQMPDKRIARLLNRAGKPTGRGRLPSQPRANHRDRHLMMLPAANRRDAGRHRWPRAGRDGACPHRCASHRMQPHSPADRRRRSGLAPQFHPIASPACSPPRCAPPSSRQPAIAKSP